MARGLRSRADEKWGLKWRRMIILALEGNMRRGLKLRRNLRVLGAFLPISPWDPKKAESSTMFGTVTIRRTR
ncbi:hypothetical protein JI75_08290 [Berryella intestinalis]|uniref:Uncharacterized protein n=1 Tax=Berryella intestinalis TaxID=1531429 RepID=A0A0A8B763_9ACTN|nr:hypothetical protein JI75_08290 [Berryella intestinalis]